MSVTQPRRRVSFVGILGELFITAGILVLLFLGWQVWLGNLIEGNEQRSDAETQSQAWNKGGSSAPAPTDRPDPGEPVVAPAPGNAVTFANLIIPRFGVDYTRPIAQGIGVRDVLEYGVGHYPSSVMPGAIGNTAYAAHRTGAGSPFFDVDKLQVGDSIYVETEDGWYQYRMRSLEYVQPTGVGVLLPVPQAPGVEATERILTLTSCNPVFTASERIIVYAVFETWYPRDGGAPAELAPLTATAAR